MRQAIAKMMVGLCVVVIAPARGEDNRSPAAGETPIARARRLIQAGDRNAAVDLLEEALIDGPAGDRPAILELLRQSYQAMARDAESAGRAADAAHYRDNLSILERSRLADRSVPESREQAGPTTATGPPTKPAARPAEPRVAPATALDRSPAMSPPGVAAGTSPRTVPAPPPSAVPPSSLSGPPDLRAPTPDPSLAEPLALPEPAKLPKPAPVAPGGATRPEMTRVPPAVARDDGTREIPMASPMTAPAASGPDQPGSREALINPGAATAPRAATPPTPTPEAESSIGRPESRSGPGLAQADALFKSGRYDEAGRTYAALAARGRLPDDRRPHWAYCRYVAVVRRINARPRSAREWDDIEAEIRNLQRLTPGNWYGEYLMNKVAEARRSRRRPSASSNGLVVRGSAPEDSAPQLPAQAQPQPQAQAQSPAPARRGLFGRSRGTSAAPIEPGSPADGPPAPASPAPGPDTSLNLPIGPSEPGPAERAVQGEATDRSPSPRRGEGRGEGDSESPTAPSSALRAASPRGGEGDAPPAWQVHETANFRIYHRDPALAERAGAIAESVRTAQAQRWSGNATALSWSPRCELYLYPTAKQYADATGQPERSPGISTMSTNEVRVLSRRMSLRADNPLLQTATLPHEVTHIVLADLFVARQIPRWADEGLAVLAEPAAERRRRHADLKEPLDGGRVFRVGQLMAMDYPAPEDWPLFYAQSVSLTQFLVDQGPPQRFIQFVRDSQRRGAEAALRDVYQIDGLAALQERWLAYARQQLVTDVASSRDPSTGPSDTRRD
jgi:hypothetical protein